LIHSKTHTIRDLLQSCKDEIFIPVCWDLKVVILGWRGLCVATMFVPQENNDELPPHYPNLWIQVNHLWSNLFQHRSPWRPTCQIGESA